MRVLLILIGDGWLTSVDPQGRPRLEDPDDFVRREIEVAIEAGVWIIPVLAQGGALPRADELPGALASIARRHPFELSDSQWREDVARLARRLKEGCGHESSPRSAGAQTSGSGRRWSRDRELRIFISYRGSDTAARASRLHDDLSGYFGRESIIMDLDRIEPGLDFVGYPPALEDLLDSEAGSAPPAPPAEPPLWRSQGGPHGAGQNSAPTLDRMGPDLADLLRAGARAGVVPEVTLDEQASAGSERENAHVAAEEALPEPPPSPAPAPQPVSAQRKGRLARPILPRLLLFAVPLAGVAALVRWLTGCVIESSPGEPGTEEVEEVQCSIFAPPSAAPGASLLVQVFAHLPLQANDAHALAKEFDTTAERRAFKTLASPVERGDRLGFHLEMPGLAVDDPAQSLVWRGRAEPVQFGVEAPPELGPHTVLGTLTLTRNSAPVGHIKFTLAVERTAEVLDVQGRGEAAHLYTAAFVSYASQDRAEVLRGVQMLRAVGIRCFQDLLDLDPGDRWERRLYSGIEESDLFLLFWSRAAHDSEWVKKETLHALSIKRTELDPPEIKPVVLERPPAEPWPEVAHIHFNDRLLYFMAPPI